MRLNLDVIACESERVFVNWISGGWRASAAGEASAGHFSSPTTAMRVALLVFTVFALCSHHADASTSWLPNGFIEKVTNTTSHIKNFVREQGLAITRIYHSFQPAKPIQPTEHVEVEESNPRETRRFFTKAIATTADYPMDGYGTADDDPTTHMNTPQLIAYHGYAAESHTVVTDDGYILTIHRIPHGRKKKSDPKKTVLLHHGLLGSSADWIIPGPEKGLAYILADAGCDVWMANVRGNTYSRSHTHLPVSSAAFWNFTFHEVSQHDLPAVIDYIMDVKGWDVKINYIGHSMGTTVLFALLSTKTQYNKVLKAGFALAPVAYMTDIKSPIRILAKFTNKIEYLMKLLGANEFLPQSAVLRWLSKYTCETSYGVALCENSIFVLCGFDEKQFNRTLLPMILAHVPAGASTKTLVHYAQEIRSGKFQQFDYGSAGNLRQYGKPEPPEYPLRNITLPIALFSATNDWLASELDITNLYLHLANPIEHYTVPLDTFNHIDFIWGKDAPTLVYKELLRVLLNDGSESESSDSNDQRSETTTNSNDIDQF